MRPSPPPRPAMSDTLLDVVVQRTSLSRADKGELDNIHFSYNFPANQYIEDFKKVYNVKRKLIEQKRGIPYGVIEVSGWVKRGRNEKTYILISFAKKFQ